MIFHRPANKIERWTYYAITYHSPLNKEDFDGLYI